MSRFISCCLPLFLLPFAARTVAAENPLQTLDREVPKLMERAHVPGVALAVVDGARVTTRVYGVANATTGERVSADTVFEAASIGKTVFAYLVLKLVERGKLSLDRPIASSLDAPYLPDARVAAITPRHVLTHRSGFPNWRPRDKDLAFVYDPGTRFSYSGEGFVYLQRAVEAVMKEPLDDTMKRLVFAPLGMVHSSYVWLPEYDAKKAWGHDAAGAVDKRRKPEGANAAATLQTTADDFGRFLSALLRHRGLREPSFREMFRPQVHPPLRCAVCADGKDSGPDSTEIAWGLGWGLLDTAGRSAFWHWGDNGSFKAYVFAEPKTKRGVVVLTDGQKGLSIAGDVAALALGETPGANSFAQRPLVWLDYTRWDAPSE